MTGEDLRKVILIGGRKDDMEDTYYKENLEE